MCCLFGMMDLNQNFSGRQKSRLLHILATACEGRGTDATGIAYNSKGQLYIHKLPVPGRKMKFHIPDDARVMMGHTRMTTQGSAKFSRNNYPFSGKAGGRAFALAHNGVLYNDRELRRTEHLPQTGIETDSYVAVQLIEKKKALHFDSLRYMAEKVEGSFSFTVMDDEDNLYFIKGDNPLCIYHYPRTGLYLYASTEEILKQALRWMRVRLEHPQKIELECGDILKLGADGRREKGNFNADKLLCGDWYYPGRFWAPHHLCWDRPARSTKESGGNTDELEYLRQLKSMAGYFGYDPKTVDVMLADGFTTDDVENMLYCGEL